MANNSQETIPSKKINTFAQYTFKDANTLLLQSLRSVFQPSAASLSLS
jgi:hypothetical protein